MCSFSDSSSAASLSFCQGRWQSPSFCFFIFSLAVSQPFRPILTVPCPIQKTSFSDLHFLLPTIFPLPCIHSFRLLSLLLGITLSWFHLESDMLPPCSTIFNDFIEKACRVLARVFAPSLSTCVSVSTLLSVVPWTSSLIFYHWWRRIGSTWSSIEDDGTCFSFCCWGGLLLWWPIFCLCLLCS